MGWVNDGIEYANRRRGVMDWNRVIEVDKNAGRSFRINRPDRWIKDARLTGRQKPKKYSREI